MPAAALFDEYIKSTVLKEGGEQYTNNPLDKGGATKWGITEARARASGYTGDMRDLPYDTAYSIYKTSFWTEPQFDQIAPMFRRLAAYMLDTGVNNGPHVPATWLQRSLNVLNSQGKLWPDLTVDGMAFRMTRMALAKFLNARGVEGQRVLLDMMQALAGVRYIELAEKNPSQELFEFGWLSNRAFPKDTPL